MKKNTKIKNTLKWLKDTAFKALVIPLLLVAGYYVHAAIVWPSTDPNPVTGIVGMFVGESASAFDAGVGYETANTYCEAAEIGSHICTPDEMINSYNHSVPESPILNYVASPNLWINNGPPGFTASANDCKGWTVSTEGSAQDPNFGAMWVFAKDLGGLTPCQTGKKFACCK